jgi:hypothetical protein
MRNNILSTCPKLKKYVRSACDDKYQVTTKKRMPESQEHRDAKRRIVDRLFILEFRVHCQICGVFMFDLDFAQERHIGKEEWPFETFRVDVAVIDRFSGEPFCAIEVRYKHPITKLKWQWLHKKFGEKCIEISAQEILLLLLDGQDKAQRAEEEAVPRCDGQDNAQRAEEEGEGEKKEKVRATGMCGRCCAELEVRPKISRKPEPACFFPPEPKEDRRKQCCECGIWAPIVDLHQRAGLSCLFTFLCQGCSVRCAQCSDYMSRRERARFGNCGQCNRSRRRYSQQFRALVLAEKTVPAWLCHQVSLFAPELHLLKGHKEDDTNEGPCFF